VSFFVKANGRTSANITYGLNAPPYASVGAQFNLSTGTITAATASSGATAGTSKIENFGNGWYRVSISGILGIAGSHYVRLQDNNGGIAGDPTKGFYIYGFQAEAGAYQTSYIPTLGAAVTRGADASSKTGISSLIGQTEGTMFIDVNITKIVDTEAISTINSGGYANNTTIARINGVIQFVRNSATQSGASIVSSSAIAIGRHKMAIAYKSGDTAFFLDGVQVSTTQTETFTNGTLSIFAIAADAIGAIPFSDSYNQTLLFPTRLTNAQLATLTTI
jgi:hypothetical protein